MKPSVGPALFHLMVNGERRAVGALAAGASDSGPDTVVPHDLSWRYGGRVVQCLGKWSRKPCETARLRASSRSGTVPGVEDNDGCRGNNRPGPTRR